jgi:capsular exopolysaccharide synthesis family protein
MLQINKSRPVERQTLSPEFLSPVEIYAFAIAFVRRQFRVIGFVFLLTLSLGVVYILASPPRYTGRAVLVLDAHKAQAFPNEASLGMPIDSMAVDTQIEVLNSDKIALSVIEQLHLDEDPEFISPKAGVVGSLVGLAEGAVNGVISVFLPSTVTEPSSSDLNTQRALNTFQSRLKIQRVAVTYAIEIDFESLNAERAAQIANAIADSYMVDSLETKYETTKRASGWLQDRLKELREQSSNAERAVVDYKTKNNIVDTGGRLMNEQQLAEFNSELMQARAQTTEAKARLDRVRQILRAGSVDPGAATTATVADTLHNEVITKLRGQYLEYDARAADWAQKYGPNHLAVVNLRNQMSELRRTIAEELKRTAESYQSDYEIAKQREESVQRSLDQIVSDSQTTNEASVTLHSLESSAQTYRALYDSFLQRYMESVQQQSFPVSESRLISQAKTPLGKSSPRSKLVLALASLIGLILGTGVAMLRDISDRVFRTTSQIREHLSADCISLIPLARGAYVSAQDRSSAKDALDLAAGRSESKAGPSEAATGRSGSAMRSPASGADSTASIASSSGSAPASGADSTASVASSSGSAPASGADSTASVASSSGSAPTSGTDSTESVAGSPESAPDTSGSATVSTESGTDSTALVAGFSGLGTDSTALVAGFSRSATDMTTSEIYSQALGGEAPRRLRTIVRDASVQWMVVDSPLSRFAEAIRAIKVAIDLEHAGKSTKVIGVTSSLPNEGKSTIAVSLAALIAHGGGRVVLVDCDLRNPSLSKMLIPSAKSGLLDVIAGKAELESVIWTEETTGLAFLPAAPPRRFAHSSEILASESFRALFEKLRGNYDYVIVDLSPLAPVVDVRVITPIIDSFLFVVEWGRTKIDVVEHALSNAQGVYDNLLGIVLNKADMNALGRYESPRGNYYYNHHYTRYGYTD